MNISSKTHINTANNPFTVRKMSFGAKPIPKFICDELANKVLKAKNIDIFCHTPLDSDTLGSATALARELGNIGKKIRIIIDDFIPEVFQKSKIGKNVKIASSLSGKRQPRELAIAVDFNSKTRLSPSGLKLFEKYSHNNVICIDHHVSAEANHKINNGLVYIDTDSKSTSEIIFQFINRKITPNMSTRSLSDLYAGMLSDLREMGYIRIDSSKNKYLPTKRIPEDTLKEIKNIEKRLTKSEKMSIFKDLDFLSRMTEKHIKFRDELINKVNLSSNNKLAYIVIEPENITWRELGAADEINNALLGDLGRRILLRKRNDSLIPESLANKCREVKAFAVFYRGKNNPVFRMSIHSKGNYAEMMTNDIDMKARIKQLPINAGGHSNRGGGNIPVEKWKDLVEVAVHSVDNW